MNMKNFSVPNILLLNTCPNDSIIIPKNDIRFIGNTATLFEIKKNNYNHNKYVIP